MPVSFAFAYARLLHSDIDREEQEKHPFLSQCRDMGYSPVTARTPGSIDHSEGNYASFSELSNTLKNVLS